MTVAHSRPLAAWTVTSSTAASWVRRASSRVRAWLRAGACQQAGSAAALGTRRGKSHQAVGPICSSGGEGDQAAGRRRALGLAGIRSDALAEPLVVDADEARGGRDHRGRASVVGGE